MNSYGPGSGVRVGPKTRAISSGGARALNTRRLTGKERGRNQGKWGETGKARTHPILAHRESARFAVKPVSVTEEAMRLDCLSTSLSLSLSLFAVTSTVTAVPM